MKFIRSPLKKWITISQKERFVLEVHISKLMLTWLPNLNMSFLIVFFFITSVNKIQQRVVLYKLSKTFKANISIIENIYQKCLLVLWYKVILSQITQVIKAVLKYQLETVFSYSKILIKLPYICLRQAILIW